MKPVVDEDKVPEGQHGEGERHGPPAQLAYRCQERKNPTLAAGFPIIGLSTSEKPCKALQNRH